MTRASLLPARRLRPRLVAGLLVIGAACTAADAAGQTALEPRPSACDVRSPGHVTAASPIRDLERVAELSRPGAQSSTHLMRGSRWESLCATDPDVSWDSPAGSIALRALPVAFGTWLNSGYAEDRNNGLVWAGRGWSTSLSGGLSARWRGVSAAFVPELAWQQNREFEVVARELPGYSPWIHAHYSAIDLPQRFGDDSYTSFDAFGQSFVRVDAHGLAAGYSHESMVIGPSIRNPVLLGASAPGFHHLFAGTSRPHELGAFRLEGEVFFGYVSESDYFDQRSANDRSGISGLSLSVRPDFLAGLELGMARVVTGRADEDRSWLTDFDALQQVFDLGDADPAWHSMSSLFARFVFVEERAEIYGEWTRSGTAAGLDDLIQEPDHGQGYTFGFQKLTPVRDAAIRIQGEWTALQERGERREGRPLVVYYANRRQLQGHTQRGQMLGAGIGPGADAQFVAADWMTERGFGGLFIERVRRNDASAAAHEDRTYFPFDHDVALTGGVRGLMSVGPLSVGGSLSYSRRYSREFLSDDTNVQLVTELVWWPTPPRRRDAAPWRNR